MLIYLRYSLDIPGLTGESQYDGISTISINATDVAGNPLEQDSISKKEYLVIDNTPPTVSFVPIKTEQISLLLIKTRPRQKMYGWLHYQVNLYSIR